MSYEAALFTAGINTVTSEKMIKPWNSKKTAMDFFN